MNTTTISMATALPRTLLAPFAPADAAFTAPAQVATTNSWGGVSPLMRANAALASRHNSIQTPIHAVRVRTVVGSATEAFLAAGSYTARKQSRPPRGTPR